MLTNPHFNLTGGHSNIQQVTCTLNAVNNIRSITIGESFLPPNQTSLEFYLFALAGQVADSTISTREMSNHRGHIPKCGGHFHRDNPGACVDQPITNT